MEPSVAPRYFNKRAADRFRFIFIFEPGRFGSLLVSCSAVRVSIG